MLTVCMVGCGNISRYHVDAIASAPAPRAVVVTALVDPDESRAAALSKLIVEKLGSEEPRIFASLEDALAADPDATLFGACDVMVPAPHSASVSLSLPLSLSLSLCLCLSLSLSLSLSVCVCVSVQSFGKETHPRSRCRRGRRRSWATCTSTSGRKCSGLRGIS